jgi:hypothetical protein
MIKIFNLILVVLIFVCNVSSIPKESKEYDLMYSKQIEEEIMKLKNYRQFIKMENAFDRYPELTPALCKGKPCWSPIIEFTNFQNNSRHINRIPAMMVISGMSGFEVMGSNAIVQFIKYAIHLFFLDVDVFAMMNNVKIIFLPNINSFGVYNRKGAEFIKTKDEILHVDPNNDFSFLQKKQCFMTNSSRIIARLFKENIIIGAINFGNNNKASMMNSWGRISQNNNLKQTSDFGFFDKIREFMKNASMSQRLSHNQLNYLTIPKQNFQYASEGSFEDWAYGASSFDVNINQNCLPEDSPYNENMINVDDKSNRALAIRLNSGFIPGRNMEMGNLISVISKDFTGSKLGILSRNVIMLKQVVSMVQPTYLVKQIWSSLSEEERRVKQGVTIYLSISGCTNVNSVQLINPIPLNQITEIDPPINNKNSTTFETRITITFNDNVKLDDKQIDLVFEIKCDQDYANDIEKYKTPLSHLLRSRQNQLYEMRRDKMIFSNKGLDKLTMYGFNYSKFKADTHILTYQKLHNEVEFIPATNYQIKIGNKPVFLLKYISGIMFKLELLPDSGISIDPKKPLYATIYSSSNYYYNFKDNSVLKRNWKKFKKPMEVAEDISLHKNTSKFKSKAKPTKNEEEVKEQKGFTFKLNESVKINATVFAWFLGQRVLIHYEDGTFDGENQGLVVIPEDVPENDFRGVLIDNGGASCTMKSPFARFSQSEEIDDYAIYFKRRDNKIEITVQIKMLSPPSEIFFKWKDKKLELTQESTSSDGSAVYTETVDRAYYPVVGTPIIIEDDDTEQLLKCYVEISMRESEAKTLQEEFKEFDKLRQDYILNEKKILQKMGDNTVLYVIIGLVVLALFIGGFFVFKFVMMPKSDKEDVEKELKEEPEKEDTPQEDVEKQ